MAELLWLLFLLTFAWLAGYSAGRNHGMKRALEILEKESDVG